MRRLPSCEVGADPGGQPGARVGAFRKERPIQRAQRGVYPVQVAAAISREEAVGDSDLIDSQPGVALQVQRLTQVYFNSKSLSEPATLLRLST